MAATGGENLKGLLIKDKQGKEELDDSKGRHSVLSASTIG